MGKSSSEVAKTTSKRWTRSENIKYYVYRFSCEAKGVSRDVLHVVIIIIIITTLLSPYLSLTRYYDVVSVVGISYSRLRTRIRRRPRRQTRTPLRARSSLDTSAAPSSSLQSHHTRRVATTRRWRLPISRPIEVPVRDDVVVLCVVLEVPTTTMSSSFVSSRALP